MRYSLVWRNNARKVQSRASSILQLDRDPTVDVTVTH